MREDFDQEELKPVKPDTGPRHDTELTLGPFVLLYLFLGLIFLCGFCFFLGYSMGRRGSQLPPPLDALPTAGVEALSRLSSNQPKPPATPQMVSSPADQTSLKTDDANPSAGRVADRITESGTQSEATLTPVDTSDHPAPPVVSPEPAVRQESATTSASALMVQVAAVSYPEDADVLVSALRKRGYKVTVHRDPADGLLHVRLGPFSNGEEAEKWQIKLLNDGYNAILQP